MVICLEQSANDLHMVQLMPLPVCHPIISASENPEWFILLVPAYPGSPGKNAVCVCVFVCVMLQVNVDKTWFLQLFSNETLFIIF